MIAAAFTGCVGADDTVTPTPPAADGPNTAPVAIFTLSPLTGDANTEFVGNAAGSKDVDGDELTFSWDWGDGSKSQGVTAKHKYGKTDTTFKVSLTALDARGLSASASKLIKLGSGNNAAPTVHLTGANLWIKPGESAAFTAHVADPDGDKIESVSWSAGRMPETVPEALSSGDMPKGGSFSSTFSTPGRYILHCHPHPWMKQTIIVDPAAPAMTQASAQIVDGETQDEFYYSPGELRVRPGTKVTWENKGAVVHTVTQEGFEPLSSPIPLTGAGGNHTFKEAGKWVVRAEAKDVKGAIGYSTVNVLVEDSAPDKVLTRAWEGTLPAPATPNETGDPLTAKHRKTFVMEFPSNATLELSWADATGAGVNNVKFGLYEGVTDAGKPLVEVSGASGATSSSAKISLPKGGYNIVVQAVSGAQITYELKLTAVQDLTPPADAGHDSGGHQH